MFYTDDLFRQFIGISVVTVAFVVCRIEAALLNTMAILESAIFWIVVAAASEIIALTPLKSNSVIQLVLNALNSIKPAKKI